MREQQVEGDVGCTQQHILVRHILREERAEISEAEANKPCVLSNKVTRTLRRDFTFVESMEVILNFALALEKEYSEKFFATRIVDSVKNMIGSDFLKNEHRVLLLINAGDLDDVEAQERPCSGRKREQ